MGVSIGQRVLRVSDEQVRVFAEASGDINPLHTDVQYVRRCTSFPQPIVHGALVVMHALGTWIESAQLPNDRWLRARFHGPVLPGAEYTVTMPEAAARFEVWAAENLAVEIDLENVGDERVDRELSNVSDVKSLGDGPTQWTIDEISEGLTLEIPFGGDVGDLHATLRGYGADAGESIGQHVTLLSWASYVAGMHLPGREAMITGLSVLPDGAPNLAQGVGRVEVTAVDRRFGLVKLAGALGGVGQVQLSVLVRQLPAELDPAQLTELIPQVRALDNQVAVVVGGSRGLGASLVQGMALQGAEVYALYRDCGAEAQQVRDALGADAERVHLVQADASNADQLAELGDHIRARHGGLDVLVLNAFPTVQPGMTGDAAQAWQESALQLVHTPLERLGELVEQRAGQIILISSEYVTSCPTGLEHYAVAKQAAEAMVKNTITNKSSTKGVIARPPRLATAYASGVLPGMRVEPVTAGIVNALLKPGTAGTATVLEDFAQPADLPSESQKTGKNSSRLAVAATFTTDPLQPPLDAWLQRLGLEWEVEFSPYGQIFQQLLAVDSALSGATAAALLVRFADWDEAGIEKTIEEFAATVRAWAERGTNLATLLIQVCPSPEPHADLDEKRHALLSELLDGLRGVHVLDCATWHGGLSPEPGNVHDPARLRIAHMPYTSEGYTALATGLARTLHTVAAPPFKVLALDCDNTLWDGVAGEDGPQGLRMRDGHYRLQHWAADLSQNGVLVCLVSKNDPALIGEVFATRTDMPLRPEMLAGQAVSWEPKSAGLIQLAEGFGLGLDSVVFLDDNPLEVAEVQANCPGVLALTVPAEPDLLRDFAARIWAFDRLETTDEDRARTRSYVSQQERSQLQRTMNFAEFMANLQLQVDIAPAAEADLRRVAQLTQRTNQFNASVQRRQESQLQVLLKDERAGCLVVRAKDRFGDYGTVGTTIYQQDADELVVDTFLLSCRALGRGVEHRMLAGLGELAIKSGCETVRIPCKRTDRNLPVRKFLGSLSAPEPLVDDGAFDVTLSAVEASKVHFDPATMDQAAPAASSTSSIPQTIGTTRLKALQTIAETLHEPGNAADYIVGRGASTNATAPPASQATQAEVDNDALRTIVHVLAEVANLPRQSLNADTHVPGLRLSSMTMVEAVVGLGKYVPELQVEELYEHDTLGELAASLAPRLTATAPVTDARASTEVAAGDVDAQPAPEPGEVDHLVARGLDALQTFEQLSQQEVDHIVQQAALAALNKHLALAALAVQETGRGRMEDKSTKNIYAAEHIANDLAGLKTVGTIAHDELTGMTQTASPVGVVAAITPVTNPTSTVIFKSLIALKTRNPIIFAFHHMAPRCGAEAARTVRDAAVAAGAPGDCIQWIDSPTRAANQALMRHPGVSVVLATGSNETVAAAYSSGKPAIGVGAGNVPAFISADANLKRAANDVLLSVTFDNGTACSAEQVLIVEASRYDETLSELQQLHAHLATPDQKRALERLLFGTEAGADDAPTARRSLLAVGKSPAWLASQAGFTVPENTSAILVEVSDVDAAEPLVREKSCPILAVLPADTADQAIGKAQRALDLWGRGHTAVIHTADQDLVNRYRNTLKAARIVWNAPAAQGAMGDLYNAFRPSLTLGCGSWGGNSIADNIGAVHLLNIQRTGRRTNNIQWFKVPPKIYFEPHSLRYLADMADVHKAVIVSGRTIARLGYPGKVVDVLRRRAEPVDVRLIDYVEPEPTVATIRRGAEMMRDFRPDTIIAIGGGSSMDAAKLMWLLYEHPDTDLDHAKTRFNDIRKRAYQFPPLGRDARLVCIPTTSGSGSEVTPFAVVTDPDSGRKYPIGDYALTPSVAIIDPTLVTEMPKGLAASAGMDALTHATEAYVSTYANDFTDGLCIQAIKLLFENLETSVRSGGDNFIAREKVHNASTLAGMALSNAFLGIVHAMSHTIGATFSLPHGSTNAILLPHVIRYNGQSPTKLTGWPKYENYRAPQRFQDIARVLGLPSRTPEQGVESYAVAIERLRDAVGIPPSFAEIGVEETSFLAALPTQAMNAYEDQCAPTNPRAPVLDDMQKLMRDAYYCSNQQNSPVDPSIPTSRNGQVRTTAGASR